LQFDIRQFLNIICDRVLSFIGSSREKCVNFIVDGKHIGYIKPEVKQQLLKSPDVFISVRNNSGFEEIQLHPDLKTSEERSDKIAKVVREWREKSLFLCLKGWRNEVSTRNYSTGNQRSQNVDNSVSLLT
jgi:hypothetical protein